MTVYNDKQPVEKIQMANNFINFLISHQTQADIGNFGVDKYGKALFTPMSVSRADRTCRLGWRLQHTGDCSQTIGSSIESTTAAK